MHIIILAFILGVLVCALVIYITNLKETIRRQREHILDIEARLRELSAEQLDRDSIH